MSLHQLHDIWVTCNGLDEIPFMTHVETVEFRQSVVQRIYHILEFTHLCMPVCDVVLFGYCIVEFISETLETV